jgi:hypothetical protein
MGCGSSSLKGTEDVGTSEQPAVPTSSNNLQPAGGGAPMKKVQTNFSIPDYASPADTKASQQNAPAPDELDEGPSRNASAVSPMATNAEPKDGILEKANVEEQKLEPYHTLEDGRDTSTVEQQVGGKTPDLTR